MIFINSGGNSPCGSKLNSPDAIRQECGDAIGEKECLKAGIEWYSADVRERYHGVKLKIFKHAFVSPFEMIEMLMRINEEKNQTIKSE